MAIVLGIDQSLSSTGMVIIAGDTIVYAEAFRTVKKDTDYVEDVMARTMQISAHICRLVTAYSVDFVVIEEPSLGSHGNATRSLAMLFGVLLSDLRKMGLTPTTVPPKSLKKAATGNGNAGKPLMLSAVPELLRLRLEKTPITKGRYDIADAYHLANYKKDVPNA